MTRIIENCYLEFSNMSDKNLSGSVIKDSVLCGCDFTDTDLRRSILINNDLTRAKFDNANLRQVRIISCKLDDTILEPLVNGEIIKIGNVSYTMFRENVISFDGEFVEIYDYRFKFVFDAIKLSSYLYSDKSLEAEYIKAVKRLVGQDEPEAVTHPDQPLIIATDGILRFKKNEIVCALLDHSSLDPNRLIIDFKFSNEDWAQFEQLLGCSYQYFVDTNLPSKIKDRIDPDDVKVDNDDPVLRGRYGLYEIHIR